MQIEKLFHVRRATFKDAAAIYEIGERAFNGVGMEDWYFSIVAAMIEEFPNYSIVAVKDKKILGFLLSKPYEESRTRFYIYWVGVDGKARGMGVGQALVERITKIAHRSGFKSILIDTQRNNLRMRHIIEKSGFQPVQQEIFYIKKLNGTAKSPINKKT